MSLRSITDTFGHMKNTNKIYIVYYFIFMIFLEGKLDARRDEGGRAGYKGTWELGLGRGQGAVMKLFCVLIILMVI